jgi:acyl-[acyl carrier protein]--UDP-N-acetylglucosamine O-acyltransferase
MAFERPKSRVRKINEAHVGSTPQTLRVLDEITSILIGPKVAARSMG